MAEHEFTYKAFSDALGVHQPKGTRCRQCGELHLPPRPMCPTCHSTDVEWLDLPQQGTLAAFTIIYIAPSAMIAAGYDRKKPYCTGVVKLDNGLSICAQILGVDVSQPDSITIGTRVTAAFVERGEGEARKTYLAFQV